LTRFDCGPEAGISAASFQFMVNKSFMVNELSIPSVDFDWYEKKAESMDIPD